ncbi:hypothetical protein MCEL_34300 [Mycolicibacterium celeriflavum]|uniref:Uncharacterized protein n=1 Tax=Mycolicibacterium celeriflavum TaxID=1249101 RepID=A0A7I7RMT2_MYCCF|nr:hypothetical protein MCEL_34300 [Mycolicibacterium celeriflavum]
MHLVRGINLLERKAASGTGQVRGVAEAATNQHLEAARPRISGAHISVAYHRPSCHATKISGPTGSRD